MGRSEDTDRHRAPECGSAGCGGTLRLAGPLPAAVAGEVQMCFPMERGTKKRDFLVSPDTNRCLRLCVCRDKALRSLNYLRKPTER